MVTLNHFFSYLLFCVCLACYEGRPNQGDPPLAAVEQNGCAPPTNSLELKAHALRDLYKRYPSELAMELKPDFNRYTKTLNKFTSKIGDISRCPFKGMNTWVVRDKSSPGNTINTSQYTCPWHVEADFDADREPEILQQVKCSCSQCIEDTGRRCEQDGTGCLHFTGSCAPILKPFPVVRRMCVTGSRYYTYEGVFEYLSVGCTCKGNYGLK